MRRLQGHICKVPVCMERIDTELPSFRTLQHFALKSHDQADITSWTYVDQAYKTLKGNASIIQSARIVPVASPERADRRAPSDRTCCSSSTRGVVVKALMGKATAECLHGGVSAPCRHSPLRSVTTGAICRHLTQAFCDESKVFTRVPCTTARKTAVVVKIIVRR